MAAFDPEKFKEFSEISADFYKKDILSYEGIISIYDTGEKGCILFHDLEKSRLILTIGGEEEL